MTAHELFTTETTGLVDVSQPTTIRLHDGDYFDLRIAPVRKNIDGDDLRMLAYNGSIPGPNLHVDQGSEDYSPRQQRWRRRRHCPLARPAAGKPLRRCTARNPGADPSWRHVHVQAAVPRRRVLLVPPAHSRGLRAGNGAVRHDRRRTQRSGVLASSRPVPDAHAGRLARRGRSCRAVPQVRSEFQCDGPVRQCHADQRRGDVFWRGSCWRGRTALSREHR